MLMNNSNLEMGREIDFTPREKEEFYCKWTNPNEKRTARHYVLKNPSPNFYGIGFCFEPYYQMEYKYSSRDGKIWR